MPHCAPNSQLRNAPFLLQGAESGVYISVLLQISVIQVRDLSQVRTRNWNGISHNNVARKSHSDLT